jgi:hypothetical protein
MKPALRLKAGEGLKAKALRDRFERRAAQKAGGKDCAS